MNLVQIKSQTQSSGEPLIEYLVYGYFFPDEYGDGLHDWELVLTTSNNHRALKKAERLYEQKKYQKIEVKKRVTDPHHNRTTGTTIKIYETNPEREIGIVPLIILGAICCIFAFLAGHYIWPL